MEEQFIVLLYYHYTPIADPEQFREEHHEFCARLGLRGRIIVAHEGLNGTVSGTRSSCEEYMHFIKSIEGFQAIDFKVDQVPDMVFEKLHVRVKPEIVHSGFNVDPSKKTGKYIEPTEFRKVLKDQGTDTVILDVRSNYEHGVGKFANAVTLDMENFREFPEKVKELKQFKDKKVITYCTGGIKCEKASAFLMDAGFSDVYQLHGGIIKYGLETGGEDFEGKCYVFDKRIVTDINTINPTIISTCYITGEPTDRMVNCANPECNKHISMSEAGALKYSGCCSAKCEEHPKVRKYDGSGYYQKKTNGYNPFKNLKRKKQST